MSDHIELDKHKKYYNKYKENDTFWAIGIENETYLEFDKRKKVDEKFFINNQKRERYSINYYESYKTNYFTKEIINLIEKKKLNLELPVLMNSHSFSKTDINNNSEYTYSKNSEKNDDFIKLLMDYLVEKDDYFKIENGNSFTFDGDTIEFMTLNFYNAKTKNVINELIANKNKFIKKLKKIFCKDGIFKKYGKINFCTKNHGFAVFLTNLNGLGIFNNMTYHFNFTLPTKLNDKKEIENYNEFINIHKKAIKIIQYMSPLLIAKYGTKDILSDTNENFSKCSQRCAVSRYIGIGTYDSDTMKKGKILQVNYDDLQQTKLDYFWYDRYINNSAYTKQDKIGMDINFNKFLNHGIEIRFFEYFPESQLFDLLELFIYLFDHIYTLEDIENPIKLKTWNDLLLNIMTYGIKYELTDEEKLLFEKLFFITLKSNKILKLLNEIKIFLKKKYKKNGVCSKLML